MHKDKKNHAKKRVEIAEGIDLNGDRKLQQLEAALRAFADFRFNSITRYPEVRYKGDAPIWKRIDDFALNSIVRHLKNTGITHASKTRVGDLLESDFSERVNPIQAYFEDLPSFEGDPIADLSNTVELVANPTLVKQRAALFYKYLKKWLVGSVANVFIEDRCANQLCFIIAGRQGAFKSTWIKKPMPSCPFCILCRRGAGS